MHQNGAVESPKPEAIDLSYHLSKLARNREVSPIAELHKYFGKPGLISLSGGLPSAEYFPFETIKADVLPSTFFAEKGQAETIPISIPKYPFSPSPSSPSSSSHKPDLSTALQYGLARGTVKPLHTLIHNLTTQLFPPLYSNFATLLNLGNCDGWMKIVTTLCNPGEGVLCSEWTYPSALVAMEPFGIAAVPVAMDGQGMRSAALGHVLAGWDRKVRGMPRPHVLYIVPVGQNPTGATMGAQRKKEIYDICVEFDVIIVEDDPYYFLQQGPYIPPLQRSQSQESQAAEKVSDEEHIASLSPTFLKFDYQGRVVRLDTFSKTIAPGSRLGWFTCHPIFAERLERQAETSTQFPSGFSQAIITELLNNWEFSGYLRWLRGLAAQYKRRRNFLIDCLAEKFNLRLAPSSHVLYDENSVVHLASPKIRDLGGNEDKRILFSFVPPTAGMFLWLRIPFDFYPELAASGQEGLEKKLWHALVEGGLLISPGNMFAADRNANTNKSGHSNASEATVAGHFRVSFSNLSNEDLEKAVDILARVLQSFFNRQIA